MTLALVSRQRGVSDGLSAPKAPAVEKDACASSGQKPFQRAGANGPDAGCPSANARGAGKPGGGDPGAGKPGDGDPGAGPSGPGTPVPAPPGSGAHS